MQLQEGSPIVVARVVQRRLGNHDVFRIEPRRQCSEVDKSPDEQTSYREENNRQRYFPE